MPRLRQQEQTNLRDVGAARDVDQVVLALGIERIRARKIMQRAEDLIDVPRVPNFELMGPHFCLRGNVSNVIADNLDELGIFFLMEKLQAIDQKLLVLAKRNRGTPTIPSLCPFSDGIKVGTDQSDHDGRHS